MMTKLPPVTKIADPLGLWRSVGRVATGTFKHPRQSSRAWARHAWTSSLVAPAAFLRIFDSHTISPLETDPKDRRFADGAWETNPYFYMLLQYYRANSRLLDELVASADLDPLTHKKARFVAELWKEASSPSNNLFSNPEALRLAFDTHGKSVADGVKNMVDDLQHHAGFPSRADKDAFTLGENLAPTEGKVVFRNDLMELIQYAPQTAKVNPTPVLLSPAWINKFYIFDLAPERSWIEHLVKNGRTVYAISYRNPGEGDGEVSFSDYVEQGPLTAIDVITEVTGAKKVDLIGICLGGTMATIVAAHEQATAKKRIRSLTLLNCLVDFKSPGMLGLFTDPDSLDSVQAVMDHRGYLSANAMAHTFDLIKSRDLVFRPLVRRWLMGEKGLASDILAWADDNTRMPANMHIEYLRRCYGENALCRDEWELAGQRIVLSDIDVPVYILGASADHIVPWEATYRTTRLMKGEKHYVLVKAGHVGAAVQPPRPKARFWVAPAGEGLPEEAKDWRAIAREQHSSWWADWVAWSAAMGGKNRRPPAMGDEAHPALADAPGTYVRAS